jgi:hypothetical protein
VQGDCAVLLRKEMVGGGAVPCEAFSTYVPLEGPVPGPLERLAPMSETGEIFAVPLSGAKPNVRFEAR